jgi:hypothetical protein
MPVVTAVERGSELARRADVGVGLERMRDFVGIFAVDASKRQARKTFGGRLVERQAIFQTTI